MAKPGPWNGTSGKGFLLSHADSRSHHCLPFHRILPNILNVAFVFRPLNTCLHERRTNSNKGPIEFLLSFPGHYLMGEGHVYYFAWICSLPHPFVLKPLQKTHSFTHIFRRLSMKIVRMWSGASCPTTSISHPLYYHFFFPPQSPTALPKLGLKFQDLFCASQLVCSNTIYPFAFSSFQHIKHMYNPRLDSACSMCGFSRPHTFGRQTLLRKEGYPNLTQTPTVQKNPSTA